MRRIVLVLALVALMVAVSVTGSALAQDRSCEGLVTAVTAQEEAPLPPSDTAKGGGGHRAMRTP